MEHGSELLSNVRTAAEHLQVQHRARVESRDENLSKLLEKEQIVADAEFVEIGKHWPITDIAK